jgi:hypothetical protein
MAEQVGIMVFYPYYMLSTASQVSRCGQLADYGLNEYVGETRLQPAVWVAKSSEVQNQIKSERYVKLIF